MCLLGEKVTARKLCIDVLTLKRTEIEKTQLNEYSRENLYSISVLITHQLLSLLLEITIFPGAFPAPFIAGMFIHCIHKVHMLCTL